jgi:ribosomal protein S18 acetylase RimI-like enzyme
MYCPKINVQIRAGNTEVIEFYRRIGFKPDEVASMGKRLETDE